MKPTQKQRFCQQSMQDADEQPIPRWSRLKFQLLGWKKSNEKNA